MIYSVSLSSQYDLPMIYGRVKMLYINHILIKVEINRAKAYIVYGKRRGNRKKEKNDITVVV